MNHSLNANQSRQFFRSIPKIELHRHLEGSVRVSTLMDIGRSYNMDIPGTGKLRNLVQIAEDEVLTSHNFLSKFQTLRNFYRSPEIIERITMEAIEDASKDNIRYLELRFTPVALSRTQGFSLDDIINWVSHSATKGEEKYGIKCRLIVSVNRNESLSLAEKVVQSASDCQARGVLAIDLAGDEAKYPSQDFAGLFKEAKSSQLKTTIHAGEWAGAENVRNAICSFQADRIGHGIRVLEDPKIVQLAKEQAIPFEVCITSNYQSGVIDPEMAHPFSRMLSVGLNPTINTDDPSISGIELSDEYQYAYNDLGLSFEALFERIEAAAQASFLPEEEKKELIEMLSSDLYDIALNSL